MTVGGMLGWHDLLWKMKINLSLVDSRKFDPNVSWFNYLIESAAENSNIHDKLSMLIPPAPSTDASHNGKLCSYWSIPVLWRS